MNVPCRVGTPQEGVIALSWDTGSTATIRCVTGASLTLLAQSGGYSYPCGSDGWGGTNTCFGTISRYISISVGGVPQGSCSSGTGSCVFPFAAGTTVTLTGSSNPSQYGGTWGGACAGTTGTTCELTLTGATSVSWGS